MNIGLRVPRKERRKWKMGRCGRRLLSEGINGQRSGEENLMAGSRRK